MVDRRRGRPQARAPRRATDWQAAAAVPTTRVSVVTDVNTPIAAITVEEGGPPPGTIVRIRGCLHVATATATGAAFLSLWACGIGLFDDRAVAVALGAGLPRPLNDADDESWMWWNCGYIGLGPNGLTGISGVDMSVGTGFDLTMQVPVESKAMRKWEENKQLVWIMEQTTVEGTATELDAVAFGRMLIKLN